MPTTPWANPSALPAGLLIRFLLRAAQTDLRAEPLLEVLGHPYTDLRHGELATGTWALRLERLFRRETGPQAGLAGLHRRAQDRDAATLALFQRQLPGMEQFVAKVAESFAPLLKMADGRARPWTELLEATGATWALLAPERPLAEKPEWADVTALSRLLDALGADAERLPPTDLAGFSADLGRLLAAEAVVPHRPQGIPIVVTGLVEARLARTDLLILAGLNEGVFPAPAATPVVLPGRVRRLLGLPTWREARARDAELFLRLLHGAPAVELSWSRRRERPPALPSPLVERLRLALDDPVQNRRARTWRARRPPRGDRGGRDRFPRNPPRPPRPDPAAERTVLVDPAQSGAIAPTGSCSSAASRCGPTRTCATSSAARSTAAWCTRSCARSWARAPPAARPGRGANAAAAR